jgi:hypothetical protein
LVQGACIEATADKIDQPAIDKAITNVRSEFIRPETSASELLLQLLLLRLRPLADLEMFSLQRQLRFLAISIRPVTKFVAVPL